jgi:hypothetical protein
MKRALLFAIPLLAQGGCTTTRVVSPGEMPALAPTLSVERFLQASNQADIHAMARLWGTADGPAIETGSAFGCAFKKIGSWIGIGDRCRTIQEVELEMSLIAEILRHEDFTVVSEARMPGREDPTTRVGVNLLIRGRDISDVPFLVVQTGEGRWLVEEIDLGKVTGG